MQRLLAQRRRRRKRWMCWLRRIHGADAAPMIEIAGGIDGSVVTEMKKRAWMNLEVEMRRRGDGVAGVPDEADDLACAHMLRVKVVAGVSGQVRVIELITAAITHPQTPAADLVPADAVDRPVRDGDDRRSERSEDVVAVVPSAGHVAS